MPHVSGIIQYLSFCVHEHRVPFHLFRASFTFFQQCFVVFTVQVSHFFGHIYSCFIHLDAVRNGTVLHAHSSCIRTGSQSLTLYLRPSRLDLSWVSKLHFSLCPLCICVPRELFLLHIRWFPSAGNHRSQRSNHLRILLNWGNPVGHTGSQSDSGNWGPKKCKFAEVTNYTKDPPDCTLS